MISGKQQTACLDFTHFRGLCQGRSNAYHRWNASQALIEILLLSKMGLKEIPNRTEYPRFAIMGLDMYKYVRGETILPHRCQSCGEWTGTLTHEECKQNLCSPCLERHNQSGCGPALAALAEDLEEEVSPGGGQGDEAQFVDDQEVQARQLSL